MKKADLKKYAHLIAKVGVNVQKGQDVTVVANVDQELLTNLVVEECYKLAGGNYFTTISSYLIAYAILQGATDIALYGMRFTIDHERRQRELDNVRQWIFFALGRGINVTIPYDKEFILPEHIVKDGQDYDQ